MSDLIVMLSKGVKSAFTNAEPNSCVVSAPVRDALAAWNSGYKSAESASGGAGVRGGY